MGVRHIRPPTARERAIVNAHEVDHKTYAQIEREFGVSNGRDAYLRAVNVWVNWLNRVHFEPGGFIAKMDAKQGVTYRVEPEGRSRTRLLGRTASTAARRAGRR